MGGLHSKTEKQEGKCKIVFQGLEASGKSSLLDHWLKRKSQPEDVQLSNEDPLQTHTDTTMNLYQPVMIPPSSDIGGRCGSRVLARSYYQDAKALVYIVDSCDHDEWRIFQMRRHLIYILEEDCLKDTILLVLANKQDLPNAWSTSQLFEVLNLHTLDAGRVCKIFPTSASTGDGVQEAFDWLNSECKKCLTDENDNSKKSAAKDGGHVLKDKLINKFKRIFLARD